MIKKLVLAFIAMLILVLAGGALIYRQEIYQLSKVLSFFEPKNISENFKSVPDIFPTKVVVASTKAEPLPVSANAVSLPATFSWNDSTINTQAFLDHTWTDGLLI